MGSLASSAGYLALKRSYGSWQDFAINAITVINQILRGKLNNTGTLTLTANAASTTLTDERIGSNSTICLMPTTANAAGALATTYFGTLTEGSCTVTHANNAQVDKIFKYTVTG